MTPVALALFLLTSNFIYCISMILAWHFAPVPWTSVKLKSYDLFGTRAGLRELVTRMSSEVNVVVNTTSQSPKSVLHNIHLVVTSR